MTKKSDAVGVSPVWMYALLILFFIGAVAFYLEVKDTEKQCEVDKMGSFQWGKIHGYCESLPTEEFDACYEQYESNMIGCGKMRCP